MLAWRNFWTNSQVASHCRCLEGHVIIPWIQLLSSLVQSIPASRYGMLGVINWPVCPLAAYYITHKTKIDHAKIGHLSSDDKETAEGMEYSMVVKMPWKRASTKLYEQNIPWNMYTFLLQFFVVVMYSRSSFYPEYSLDELTWWLIKIEWWKHVYHTDTLPWKKNLIWLNVLTIR